jgi:hypothetical protein
MNQKLNSTIKNKRKQKSRAYDFLLSQYVTNSTHAKHAAGFCIKLLALVPDGHDIT